MRALGCSSSSSRVCTVRGPVPTREQGTDEVHVGRQAQNLPADLDPAHEQADTGDQQGTAAAHHQALEHENLADAGALLHALGITDRNIPYFFTVDPAGKIVHRESGKFEVDKLDALEEPML